jgi:formylglycine-generating enzyme required for sulfatase activity
MNVKDTTPVGQYSPKGDSPFELQDMAGNVWEWCWDGWDKGAYARRHDGMKDPFTPNANTEQRVVRGGSFRYNRGDVRCACRGRPPPDTCYVYGGVRVCASPILLSL